MIPVLVFFAWIIRRDSRTLVAQGKNPLGMTARDVMSSPAVTVTPDTRIEDCCQTLEDKQVRRVPVIDLAAGTYVIGSPWPQEVGTRSEGRGQRGRFFLPGGGWVSILLLAAVVSALTDPPCFFLASILEGCTRPVGGIGTLC